MNIDLLRALIRPVGTGILLIAYIVYAHFDPDAFERIKEITLVALSFYFGTRQSK